MMKVLFFISAGFMMMGFNFLMVFYINFYMILSIIMLFMYKVVYGGGVFINIGSCYMGWDVASFFMVILSLWVFGLMVLSVVSGDGGMENYKVIMFNFTLIVLIGFFSVNNFMLFYFFFEVSLIPTFFMVVWWGGGKERVLASFYLLMYMMFLSFPLLLYVMKFYGFKHTLNMGMMSMSGSNFLGQGAGLGAWDFLIVFGAFFIKLPIYLFHVWLPKAHVEAPVYGSMMLAAVLLKLGGYGLLRLIVMFMEEASKYGVVLISLGLVGSLYTCVSCMVQADIKGLVALSSVVHMNFTMSSFFTMMRVGVLGGIISLVSHGVCSSGLFYMVGVFYKRSFSRMLMFNKGVLNMMPSMSVWWFFLCASNFSYPFSVNFLGEISMIMALLGWDLGVIVLVVFICFFSGAYSLYLFSVMLHGNNSLSVGARFDSGVISEYLGGMVHYFLLLIMMFCLGLFTG